MPIAHHNGGPMDGYTARIDGVPQTRHWAKARARTSDTWIALARYVFVPPRDGKDTRYTYTGTNQAQGPIPGNDNEPEWS